MTDLDLIRVTPPVIEEQLATLKAKWMQKAADAKELACTEDTIQAVKKARAEMRKEFDEIETQRKAALAPIRAKIDAFSAVYKDCVTDPFNRADAAYKEKIDSVESEMKRRCEERLRAHFAELCQLHGVDFIRYEQVGIKIDMTSAKAKTPQKLYDRLSEFVAGVACGVDTIHKLDAAAEIMDEYKRTLNVAQSIATVQERHKRIEEEEAAQAAREEARRRQEDAVAKVEAVAPPAAVPPPTVIEPPKPAEPELQCTFTVYATREKLVALKKFLIQEGIRYE